MSSALPPPTLKIVARSRALVVSSRQATRRTRERIAQSLALIQASRQVPNFSLVSQDASLEKRAALYAAMVADAEARLIDEETCLTAREAGGIF